MQGINVKFENAVIELNVAYGLNKMNIFIYNHNVSTCYCIKFCIFLGQNAQFFGLSLMFGTVLLEARM